MKSTMFSVNTKDALRGLIIAVLVPVFVIIQQSIVAGGLTFDWKSIGVAALGGFLAYITKNFLTDSVKQAQTTIIDAKVAEVKKTALPPEIQASKIEAIKQNPPQ